MSFNQDLRKTGEKRWLSLSKPASCVGPINIMISKILGSCLFLLVLSACNVGNSPTSVYTVSEVWENAETLNGKQIRVRGFSRVYTEPYVGMIGCPPAGTIEDDVVVGQMVLLPDEGHFDRAKGITISEKDLKCEGGHCRLSCAPFDPGDMDYCMAERGRDAVRPASFELVGTLQVQEKDGEKSLMLENIILEKSLRLLADTWEPIPTATIHYGCP